jgi:hypothetical protein
VRTSSPVERAEQCGRAGAAEILGFRQRRRVDPGGKLPAAGDLCERLAHALRHLGRRGLGEGERSTPREHVRRQAIRRAGHPRRRALPAGAERPGETARDQQRRLARARARLDHERPREHLLRTLPHSGVTFAQPLAGRRAAHALSVSGFAGAAPSR